MKQSKLIAAIAMTGLAATMIGCSRKGDDAKPAPAAAPAAQTLAHKADQCPKAAVYQDKMDDGLGDRQIDVAELNGAMTIVQSTKTGPSSREAQTPIVLSGVEVKSASGISYVAKCSEGNVFVSFSAEGKATKNMKLEFSSEGNSLRLTETALPSNETSAPIEYVRVDVPAAPAEEDHGPDFGSGPAY